MTYQPEQSQKTDLARRWKNHTPPTKDAQSSVIVRLLKKRWPKRTKAHKEARAAIIDVYRQGLDYADIEALALAAHIQLDEDKAEGILEPRDYFAAVTKLIEVIRRLRDSRSAVEQLSAPGTFRIEIEDPAGHRERIAAHLEALGHVGAAEALRGADDEGVRVLDAPLIEDGPGDELIVS